MAAISKEEKSLGSGYCRQMCPPKETEMRLENDLVHPLEAAAGPNAAADSFRLVKKFSRSAAGSRIEEGEVRSPTVCVRTAEYLVREIVCHRGSPLNQVRYDFVFDRLRAVRQDLSVRGCRDRRAARVLRICVRFHLYSGHALCHLVPSSGFDPVTNFVHALDCLKALLKLRQEARDGAERGEVIDEEEEEEEMSSAYLVLNLGSSDSIKWGLAQERRFRSLPSVSASLACNFCLLERNYARLFRLVRRLPITSLLAFQWKLPAVLLDILTVMSSAYNSKALTYPTSEFSRLYCLGEGKDFVSDLCRRLGVETAEAGTRIAFRKKTFGEEDKIPHFRTKFVEAALEGVDLSHYLLQGCRA